MMGSFKGRGNKCINYGLSSLQTQCIVYIKMGSFIGRGSKYIYYDLLWFIVTSNTLYSLYLIYLFILGFTSLLTQ